MDKTIRETCEECKACQCRDAWHSCAERCPTRDVLDRKELNMNATYANPWHNAGRPEYGPATYATDAKPASYRGYLIYERIKGQVWDVVLDGKCLIQMAGPRGAREAIDEMCEV